MARASIKLGGKIKRTQKRLDDPRAALNQIGVLMVAESQRAFKEQAFGGKRWEPRGPINIFGLIADFASGKTKPPNRRFERQPVLRDTGALAKSVAHKLVSSRVVEVGTVVTYASVHQFGGKVESKPLTKETQKRIWSWLKGQSKQLKRRLSWLTWPAFTGKKLTGTVPARPFVGITKQTRMFVLRAVGVSIMETK